MSGDIFSPLIRSSYFGSDPAFDVKPGFVLYRGEVEAMRVRKQRPMTNGAGIWARVCELAKDKSGASALILGLSMPALVGLAGLGVDASMWMSTHREHQNIADSAALAAAFERAYDQTGVLTIARAEALRHNFNPDDPYSQFDVNSPPLSGAYQGDAFAIEVVMGAPLSLGISSMFVTGPVVTNARAVATTVVEPEFCILGLDPSRDDAVSFSGSASATLGCGLASNSASDESISISGSSSVTTTSVTAVGDVSDNGGLTTSSPPRVGSNPIIDPYENLTVPTFSGCDHNNEKVMGDETLNEGVYCGGLRVQAGGIARLNPGTYIMDRGDFDIKGGGTVIGTDVTIVLTSSNGSNYATIDINANATVQLSAPSANDTTGIVTGDYAGILFFQDPNATGTQGGNLITNKISGNSDSVYYGVIYIPNQAIALTGSATFQDGCVQLIAATVSMTGNFDITDTCTDPNLRDIGRLRVALVE